MAVFDFFFRKIEFGEFIINIIVKFIIKIIIFIIHFVVFLIAIADDNIIIAGTGIFFKGCNDFIYISNAVKRSGYIEWFPVISAFYVHQFYGFRVFFQYILGYLREIPVWFETKIFGEFKAGINNVVCQDVIDFVEIQIHFHSVEKSNEIGFADVEIITGILHTQAL